jgi:hypothetical protein
MTHARRNKVAEWRDSHRKRFPVSTIAPPADLAMAPHRLDADVRSCDSAIA